MPPPCLLLFMVAYYSLPNFLSGFELRLSHFITGLKDWNKDCPLFLLTGKFFFVSFFTPSICFTCAAVVVLFLRRLPIIPHTHFFFRVISARGVYSIIADNQIFSDLSLTRASCGSWCGTHLFPFFREWGRSQDKLWDVTVHNESTMTEYVVLPDPVSSSDENVLLLGSKALWHKALCVPLAVPFGFKFIQRGR